MFRHNRKSLIYLFILIVPFLLFFTRPNSFATLQFKFIEVSKGPLEILSFPLKELKKILYYHRTFDEYRRLKTEVDVLKARLTGFEEVARENTRLETLLEFKRRLIYSSVAANVIGRDPSRWNASMVIDKGESDGIKQGMPVVNALGVVGKIAQVGAHSSKVILLTDPQFSVAALIQRASESGLVSGTLQGVCRLRYINEDADIRAGDKVITSKLSSSFPEGLIIGEVLQVNESLQRPSIECIVQPAVSFSQIEEVLVIVTTQNE